MREQPRPSYDRSALLRVAVAATRAGEAVFRSGLTPDRRAIVAVREPGDYTTAIDLEVESAIVACLRLERPDDTIVAEEVSSTYGTSGLSWFVDPIDGTRNVVAGRQEVAICVGLVDGTRPILGSICLPHENIFLAGDAAGGTVTVNDHPYRRASADIAPSDVLLSLPSRGLAALLPTLGNALPQSIRITGALGYDLALLALGRVDARLGGFYKNVDAVAGVAIVRAAGGFVVGDRGEPWAVGSRDLTAVSTMEIYHWLRGLDLTGRASAQHP